jgi:hypothetical protein
MRKGGPGVNPDSSSGKGGRAVALIKKLFLSEIKLKSLALALSVTLWISMTYVGESKMGFLVPLSFEDLGKGMAVSQTDTKDVMITVSGPLSMLKNLKADDIRVPVNLARAKEGRQTFTIRKGDVIVPAGLRVEDANPDYVVVELDKLVEKRLPVVVKLDKRWADSYEVVSWRPMYVEVEGPRELLEKGTVLETLPVNGNFTRQQEVLDIPLDAKSLEARRVTPGNVTVTLRRIDK